MSYATIRLERTGPVAALTLERPGARNAIDMAMRSELLDALDKVEGDAGARVLILAGAGGHFSAGGDMKSLRERPPTAQEHRERVRILNRLVVRLFGFSKPTIAAVDGYAMGSGCTLALCCDIVLASRSARFGMAFGKVGLVPDGGASWLLPRLIGPSRAKEWILTAEVIDAEEAARLGLVSRVLPAEALERTARELAGRIAQGAPRAQSAAKALINAAMTSELAAALEAEALAQSVAVTGEEHREGLAALFEKRTPRF